MKPESRNKPQLLQVPSDSKFSIKTNVGFISDQERRLSQIVVFFVTILSIKIRIITLTQEQAAEQLLVSRQTISSWENGGSLS